MWVSVGLSHCCNLTWQNANNVIVWRFFLYDVSLERERKRTQGHFLKLLLARVNTCFYIRCTQHSKSFWNCGCSSQRPRALDQRCVLAHILNWGTGNGIQREKKMNWRIPSDNQRTQRHKHPKGVPKLDYIRSGLWPLKTKLPVMPGFCQVNQRYIFSSQDASLDISRCLRL